MSNSQSLRLSLLPVETARQLCGCVPFPWGRRPGRDFPTLYAPRRPGYPNSGVVDMTVVEPKFCPICGCETGKQNPVRISAFSFRLLTPTKQTRTEDQSGFGRVVLRAIRAVQIRQERRGHT